MVTLHENGHGTNNSDKLDDLLIKINDEFENLESFLEVDEEKSNRFRSYIKTLYDYIKIQDDNDYISSSSSINTKKNTSSANSTSSALPELIVDNKLVDLEQIYQQLQLYNQNSDLTSSASINSLTKFFSKCLVHSDSISFNVNLNENSISKNISGSSLSNEDSVDAEADEEYEEEDDQDQDDDEELDEDDNDSLDDLINYTKSKTKKDEKSFGIPDGDDSEIEDFEAEENEDDDDDDDDEEADDNVENEEQNEEDIDSDEVDEDLNDMYDDIDPEQEKELMGIGKPQKGFEEVDFDREDFGLDHQEPESRPTKKTKDLFGVKDDDDDEENINKSSFEKRSEKLKEQIDEIHESMLGNVTDKPWQLKGEITAKTRPQDSLLQEYLEFDHTTRQAPIINASTTEQIEKMIKQRIKDKAFDDVERKVKPVDMQYEYKKQIVLDSEKSKVGLGDVYEQEFLKQQQKESGEVEERPKEEAANPKHEDIRKKMQSLFIKLDALSNFHFTPKAPVPELKVVSNMPTIAMEEVAPVNVADTNVLAPEEVKAKIKALPKSKSEETKSDKNRNLRVKKLISKKKKTEKEKRLQIAQALDPNNEKVNKEIAMNKLKKQAKNLSKNIKILKQDKKTDKAYKSSSAFFKQLQENTELSKNKVNVKKKLSSNADEKKSSKKLKL
ncbi:unnamed protein product [Brachionus calyciflorus]|uniref:U3 small nucleolar ribonucleoprotein protein MPP10 n=1 Tax=Brachionus calyciflorus TaxID=104777 RepID=A0A813RNP8_9BILA|nr:unnamed protein product [Brachionus calyciflorus]